MLTQRTARNRLSNLKKTYEQQPKSLEGTEKAAETTEVEGPGRQGREVPRRGASILPPLFPPSAKSGSGKLRL